MIFFPLHLFLFLVQLCFIQQQTTNALIDKTLATVVSQIAMHLQCICQRTILLPKLDIHTFAKFTMIIVFVSIHCILIINPSTGMDQEIHPCGQEGIEST